MEKIAADSEINRSTVAKLLRPGGLRAVSAESLLLKRQLLISNRSRHHAANLTTLDHVVLGLTTQFVNARRMPKLTAIILCEEWCARRPTPVNATGAWIVKSKLRA